MRKTLASTLLILLAVFTDSTFANDQLIGSWVHIYKDSLCNEIYTFNKDGTYQTKSLDEEIQGKYLLEPVNGSARLKLSFLNSHDNGLKDCAGQTKKFDLSGFLFVEISGNKITYYEKPDSTSSIIELERVK